MPSDLIKERMKIVGENERVTLEKTKEKVKLVE